VLLEPEKHDENFKQVPETYEKDGVEVPWNNRDKYCQNWVSTMQNNGFVVTQGTQVLDAHWGKKTIKKNYPLAADALWGEGAEYQVSIIWTHKNGVRCKMRIDILKALQSTIIDLKSTQDPMPFAFTKTCGKFGYHIQAGMYTEGAEIAFKRPFNFDLVAVLDKPPFTTKVYHMDVQAIIQGRNDFYKAAEIYKSLIDKPVEEWRGITQDDIEEISIPPYMLNNADEGEDINYGYTAISESVPMPVLEDIPQVGDDFNVEY
jgi:hypothetical protein